MDDLISRQTAIDVADYADCTGLAAEDVKKVTDEVVKELKKLPPVDAVQVVRCKDCKHSYTMMTARAKDGSERWTRFCNKHKDWYPKDNWYCGDAEREEL